MKLPRETKHRPLLYLVSVGQIIAYHLFVQRHRSLAPSAEKAWCTAARTNPERRLPTSRPPSLPTAAPERAPSRGILKGVNGGVNGGVNDGVNGSSADLRQTSRGGSKRELTRGNTSRRSRMHELADALQQEEV